MASIKDIKNAVDEVKEDLILHNYNDAMILMAQITIDLIGYLVDENLMVSKGYQDDLNTLLASNKISERTGHNFETLIISGIQAHNGVSIPDEHAKQALEVLEDELGEILESDSMPPEVVDKASRAEHRAKNNIQDDVFEYNDEDEDQPVFMSPDDENDFRSKERLRQDSYKYGRKKINIRMLFVLIFPIVLILSVAMMIRSCINSGGNAVEETPTDWTTPDFMAEPLDYLDETETEPPETTSEAGYYIVTTDLLNVRAEANKSSAIRGRVNTGDTVYVEKFYDNDWAIIRYEGRNAYISRQYIVRSDNQSIAPELNER